MGSKSTPDIASDAKKGIGSDLALFPFKNQIDALAQMGGKAVINGREYDFTGRGNAETNFKVSDQMAQALLDIQHNYGSAFIKQRLAALQRSDPNGYAARKQLFDKILADADAQPDRPLAEATQAQVQSLLGQGSNLTTGPNSQTEAVQQNVRGRQIRNGITLGNAPASAEATALVQAGDQVQQQRQQQAAGFLNSGVSPEDVEYRRIQQSLSNLGSAINGQTPTAQFQSLSGQGGAAPFQTGRVSAPTLNPNAAMQGVNSGADIYSGNVNWSSQQANPWTAGLSTGISAAGMARSMGWNPGGGGVSSTQSANVAAEMGGFGGSN